MAPRSITVFTGASAASGDYLAAAADFGSGGLFGALAPYVPSPPQIGGPPPRTTPQGARAGQPTTGSNR